MSRLSLLCRNATALNEDGSINEDDFRRFLQRFVDAKIGVYLASAGSGEGGAMTAEELLRVYKIGVEVCKGKVQVNGNPPEKPTVRGMKYALALVRHFLSRYREKSHPASAIPA